MDVEKVRAYCLSLPHVTENQQWGESLVFRIGQKIFAVLSLDPAYPFRISVKCSPERYFELIEQEGISPAPYLARNHWVALRTFDALPPRAFQDLVRGSYDLVRTKLARKVQAALA